MRIAIAALQTGALLLTLSMIPASAFAQGKDVLKTKEDKISYSIGLSVGRNLRSQDITVTPEKFVLGVRDAMKDGGELLLSDDEIREVMVAFQTERRRLQAEAQNRAAAANAKAGADFLAANKKKKGVTTTTSGLQYKVLTAGTGKSPTAESTVTAHYKGTLIDGTEFDSSYARGQPAQFPVNGVIAGWSEVLQLMKVGAKWLVWIPPSLAYGEQGAGQRIGPNSTLIFEIELIEIQ